MNEAPAVKSGEVLGYLDDPSRRYTAGLKKVKTKTDLLTFLVGWPFLAADATEQSRGWTDADVRGMQKSRRVRGKGVEAAVRKYGLVLLPTRLLTLTQMALRFTAPEGAVYIRLWETGEHDRLMDIPNPERCS